MNARHVIFLALLLAARSPAQVDGPPLLEVSETSGGKIIKTEFYSGRALFGYIDGGAELYLEYGFRKLSRQEVEYPGERLVVEVYQMGSPIEAFGIFSVQRFKCVPVDSLLTYTCQSQYQLQAVMGNCYLSIISESGSSTAQKLSVGLFRTIQSKVTPRPPQFPDLFRSSLLKPHLHDLVAAMGILGLQNGFSDWEPLFKGIRRFSLTLLPIEAGSDRLTIAHIRFESAQELKTFCGAAGFEVIPVKGVKKTSIRGILRFAYRAEESTLIFAEASPSFPGLDSYLQALVPAADSTSKDRND